MQFLSELVKYFLEDLFFIFMKVLKKIGLGIISLGLISTFYIPEAKANQTIVEFDANGSRWAIKLVTRFNANYGKFLFKEVGSGKTSCKTLIGSVAQAARFSACASAKVSGVDVESFILSSIKNVLDL
tara:strand:+ start:179 stop:562 length:384 start_codon:yes stop_codon:yes gene_type:complete